VAQGTVLRSDGALSTRDYGKFETVLAYLLEHPEAAKHWGAGQAWRTWSGIYRWPHVMAKIESFFKLPMLDYFRIY